MKSLHLLLGGSQHHQNCIIEAIVLDVCYNRGAVNYTKVRRLGQFLRQGCCGTYDMLILTADHLVPEHGRPLPSPESLVNAIWTVKNQSGAPLIVTGVDAEMEYRVKEAGAEAVLLRPWKADQLRGEVQRLIALPEPQAAKRQTRWPLAGLFKKAAL